ncbi:RimJ/RimL family protein N-acetyltransferase [Kineothrix alysoides]|uniref:RimJ/RimL family protein N-acetyltransferase n=1 Tax=Kineothrix alysoides TaxID=1469948 RepID=A0A4R1QL53_9FIRM|nr:GNAT family N-acetyltransferase [Kineothrix alysoides]TCL53907.1 RimJ/RimL family protein N-acetyltransferase [Kineothrix alysoides]
MITTKRLVIKPYSDEDQGDMILLLVNEKVKETYIIPDFNTRDEALSMFKKIQKLSYSDDHYEFGIYKDNQLIGWVNDVYKDAVKIELGYVIDPDYHNNGYATEVLKAVIEDIFLKGFNEIVTGTFVTNKASIKVIEKCGMKRIDREEDIVYQDKLQHCIYYAIKRER